MHRYHTTPVMLLAHHESLKCFAASNVPLPRSLTSLHPEHSPLCFLLVILATHRCSQTQPEHPPRMTRRNNAIIPKPRTSERCLTLPFNASLELWICLTTYSFHDRGELLSTHHGGPSVGPGEEKARRVCTATIRAYVSSLLVLKRIGSREGKEEERYLPHAIVSRTRRTSEHHREFRNFYTADCCYKLRSILCYPAFLCVLAYHKP